MKNRYKNILLSVFFLPNIFLGNVFSDFATEGNQEVDIRITEVMSNPMNEDTEEFIEIANMGSENVDISQLLFTDGDSLDEVVLWNEEIEEKIILKPNQYAVILDAEYVEGMQYIFPENTLLLTTKDTTLGNGLTQTDAITLFYENTSMILDTYGTPLDEEDWQDRDDDELDEIPLATENGFSIERVNYENDDNEDNWKQSEIIGGTPGRENSIHENHIPNIEVEVDGEVKVGEVLYIFAEVYDEDEDEIQIEWNMGDGTIYDDEDVEHVYKNAGEYEVRIMVSDGKEEIISVFNINVIDKEKNNHEDIIITEVFPNPEGTDEQEFIEIYNQGSEVSNLQGLGLKDDTQRTFWVELDEEESSIEPNEYRVFYKTETGISLNNSGVENVYLIDENNAMLDQVSYNNASESKSFSLIEGEWIWTESITPGGGNIFSETREEITEEQEEEKDVDDSTEGSIPEEDNEEVYELSNEIKINELLPDPEGSDEENEWMEIYNSGESICLYKWKIEDASSKYIFPKDMCMDQGSFLIVRREQSGITLNNSEDSVRIIDPEENIVDEVSYKGAKEGFAWAKDNQNSWNWTQSPTPGEGNKIESEIEENDEEIEVQNSEQVQIAKEKTKKEDNIQRVTIEDVYTMQKGEEVRVQGMITASPGVFDEKSCYIQDETQGIKIYFGKSDWPDMKEGEVWEFFGKISEANGEKKINISKKEDIQRSQIEVDITPFDISSSKKDTWKTGSLTKVSGTIVKSTKTQSTITTTAGEEVDLSWKAQGIDKQTWNQGKEIEIIAILRATKTEPYLMARKNEDIKTFMGEEGAMEISDQEPTEQLREKNSGVEDKITFEEVQQSLQNFDILIMIGCISFGSVCGAGVMITDNKWKWMQKIKDKVRDLQKED